MDDFPLAISFPVGVHNSGEGQQMAGAEAERSCLKPCTKSKVNSKLSKSASSNKALLYHLPITSPDSVMNCGPVVQTPESMGDIFHSNHNSSHERNEDKSKKRTVMTITFLEQSQICKMLTDKEKLFALAHIFGGSHLWLVGSAVLGLWQG